MERNIQQDFPKVSENWNFLPMLTGKAFEFLEVIFFYLYICICKPIKVKQNYKWFIFLSKPTKMKVYFIHVCYMYLKF